MPHYDLLSSQCYVFAQLVVEFVENNAKPEGIIVSTPIDGKQMGRFGSVRLPSPSRQQVLQVITETETLLKNWNDGVSFCFLLNCRVRLPDVPSLSDIASASHTGERGYH